MSELQENESRDPLDDLLGPLQPRRAPPPQMQARAFAEVHAAWRGQRRQTWQRRGALAAAVVAGVFGASTLLSPAGEICLQLADGADVWIGETRVRAPGERTCFSPGTTIAAEQTTRYVGPDDIEMRLRAGSRVQWHAADRLALDTGAIYVATRGKGSIAIETPFGEVRDIGTVFGAEVDEHRLVVALREGSVQIDSPRGRHVSVASGQLGERVVVDAQRVVAEPLLATDAVLDWIFAAHPGYTDRQAHRVLEQIAGDLGRRVKYASAELEARAVETELIGSLEQLGPRDALEVVAGVCDFSVVETDGVLEIGERVRD